MNQEDLYQRFITLARQDVHVIVSAKLQFQRVIRRMFGPTQVATINASVNPFILPLICYDLNFDMYIFIIIWIEICEKEK